MYDQLVGSCCEAINAHDVEQEKIRMLQLLVSSHCPLQASVLSEPLYSVVIAFIQKSIQVLETERERGRD
jgi:hypothetical protein